MSGIIAKIIGLRLVGTTKFITKQNTTKYLQSMCHVRNRCSHITKNPITPAQKESAGYWKTIENCSVPLTIIGMNIVIYCAYKIKTNERFWGHVDMWIAARKETLKYSIIPSKIITSSVLFDDSKIEISTIEDDITLINNNTRNLILSKELDANMQEPFPRGEPIPVKVDRFNGLLENGKLTLKKEDGDTTFTFYQTLSLEVKKTSTTLQDKIAAMKKEPSEIIQRKISKFHVFVSDHRVTLKTSKGEKEWPVEEVNSNSSSDFCDSFPVIGNFSFSYENTVIIQADKSDEVYHLIHNVKLECDKKVDENLQNIVVTNEVPRLDLLRGITAGVFDSGTVVFKTQDGRKIILRNSFKIGILEDGPEVLLNGLPQCMLDYV